MKKLGIITSVILTVGLLASCTVYRSVELTGAPVGTKRGVAKGFDYTLKTAAKNGNIQNIGSAETTIKMFIIPFPKTVVTGE